MENRKIQSMSTTISQMVAMPAIVLSSPAMGPCEILDAKKEAFGAAVLRVIVYVNHVLKESENFSVQRDSEYFSVQREAHDRWSVMGLDNADWLEFQYLGPKGFQLSRQLNRPCCMTTDFHLRGRMEDDVLSCFNMLFVRPKKMN